MNQAPSDRALAPQVPTGLAVALGGVTGQGGGRLARWPDDSRSLGVWVCDAALSLGETIPKTGDGPRAPDRVGGALGRRPGKTRWRPPGAWAFGGQPGDPPYPSLLLPCGFPPHNRVKPYSS